ncbi:uncharacterized protein PHACADRAFT_264572 [Phanerochaete carnosa HHB-10118-sp]|uniref:Uncharacterized protein n=1 Tax=Phanerochaete carnosa (strain HHB-10118-sp) TaxID=650164 RepID=K5VU15_PHACS|nr:uncharacterized protein PHACADRAFT_264572 [Phanerochaete carnosa HHB-10118-sp]EKM50064.1 hypothetical protein PHACADRAFT_264572 [Phanerochaete carnosa HHB-10118-sp]
MSDAATTPPVRILPSKSSTISSQEAYARVSSFLEEFQQRSTPLSGGDATVPAQLSKLTTALREEQGAK